MPANSEKILKHLFIEFYLGKTNNEDKTISLLKEGKSMLFEEYGCIPYFDEYLADFRRALNKYKNFGGGIITAADFNDITDKFFDAAQIVIVPDIENGIGGGYSKNNSGFYRDDHGRIKYKVRIILSLEAGDDIVSTFMHELTHAYDDYNRKKHQKTEFENSGKTKTFNMVDYAHFTGYDQIAKAALKDDGGFENIVGNILYYLDKTERNAWFGELKTYLAKNAHRISDTASGTKVLKETPIYSIYKELSENMEGLYSFKMAQDLIKEKQEILNSFNKLSKKKFDTFNKMYKYLYTRYKRWERKFLNHSTKIIYQLYEKYHAE